MRRYLVRALPLSLAACLGGCGSGADVLAEGSIHGSFLVLDDSYLYWVQTPEGGSQGEFVRMDRAGGEPTVLAATTEGFSDCVIDNESVFVTESMPGDVPNSLLKIDRLNPDSATTVATNPTGGFADLAANSTHLYWRVYTDMGSSELHRVSKTGEDGVVLNTGLNFTSLAADDAGLAWAAGMGGELTLARTDGTEQRVVETGASIIGGMISDGDRVFISSIREIWQINRSDGQSAALQTTNCNILAFTMHGTSLFWSEECTSDEESGYIFEYDLDRDELVSVATDQPRPRLIAADEAGVYWVNTGGRTDQLVGITR